MDWQATDQFGNLFVAESGAQSLDELRPHLASLLSEARERAGDEFQVTVDLAYQEVNAPDPESVSHVLRVPWLAGQPRETLGPALADALSELCAAHSLPGVTIKVV